MVLMMHDIFVNLPNVVVVGQLIVNAVIHIRWFRYRK